MAYSKKSNSNKSYGSKEGAKNKGFVKPKVPTKGSGNYKSKK